ncbi:MAG: hypothetical protein D6705_15860, partial [Deltaproteobacteria bacterium]
MTTSTLVPRIGLAGLLVATVACGDKTADEASIAKAFDFESKERKVAEELEAKRLAELAKKKAEKEAKERALVEAIDKAATLPADMPKDKKEACEKVVRAYENFMRNNRDVEAVTLWFEHKSKNLGKVRGICLKGSLEGASCLAHALENAPDPLYDMAEEGVAKLKDACARKYVEGKPV